MKKNNIQKIIISICVVLVVVIAGGLVFGRQAFPLKYKDTIKEYAKDYNVDPYLVAALIRRQSGFYDVGYKKGDKSGPMEIREKTAMEWAKEIGIKGYKNEMVGDVDTNIKLGTWYLSKLKKESKNMEDILAGWCNRHVKEGIKLTEQEIERFVELTKKMVRNYKIIYPFALR